MLQVDLTFKKITAWFCLGKDLVPDLSLLGPKVSARNQPHMWGTNQMVHWSCTLCCIQEIFNSLNLSRSKKLHRFWWLSCSSWVLCHTVLLQSLFTFTGWFSYEFLASAHILTHFFIDTDVNCHCVQAHYFYWEVETSTHATFAVSLPGFFPPRKIYKSQAEYAAFCWAPAVSSTVYAAAHPQAHGSLLNHSSLTLAPESNAQWFPLWNLPGCLCELSC